MYRGQNYHYQRGYELSRLRYENRLKANPTETATPKTFFVREYHQGRDVPKELLRLTQNDRLLEQPSTTSAPIVDGFARSADNMKTMSDYQQKLYVTKAALKAAIQAGDKDFSILDYLNKLKAKLEAQKQGTGGGDGQPNYLDNQQSIDGKNPTDGNQSVRFDEQIKEDLNKIAMPYDPR